MRRGIRWRLSVYQIATISVAMVAVAAVVESSVRDYYLDRLDQHLARQAALVRQIAEDPLVGHAPRKQIERLARALGRKAEARVTIVGPDGTVFGDSLYQPPQFPNLAFRPEIRAILRKQVAGQPHAQAIRADGMHVAVPVRQGKVLLGIVRVSLSLEDLDDQLRELRILILGTVLLATMAAVVATLYVTRSIMGPVQEVTEAAQRMAGGDLTPRVVANPHDEIGQLTRAFNTMAERIQATMLELDGEREKMARIFTRMADGLVVADRDLRVLLMNPAAERLLGLPAGDVTGRSLAEALPLPDLVSVARGVLNTGRERSADVLLGGAGGQLLGVFAAPVADRPGAPQGVMLVLHDLTEAQRTERIRREFVANASHELRTPIAAVKIMVESLLGGAQEDPLTRARFLHLVDREADRLSGLVTDLLDLSQMDAGQWPLEPEVFSLSEVTEAVAAKFALVAADRNQHLTAACGEGIHVWADKRSANQVLSNLVSNAIRYTPEGGEIAIEAEARGEVVALRVRDTGIGIPKAEQEHVFERFYRVDKARSRELGGTGLGLAIVRHLVEAQSGTVSVESNPGEGSVFTVLLPGPPVGNAREEAAPGC